MAKALNLTQDQVGLKYGFRSGLEETTAEWLRKRNIPFDYEAHVINYIRPERKSKYTPDFILPNGIVVETKGRLLSCDRQKHLLLQAQYPELDVRFVFSNSRSKISKQSSTSYGAWCERYGFIYADKEIPEEWLTEPKKELPSAVQNVVKKKA